jgi:hypothetical protein
MGGGAGDAASGRGKAGTAGNLGSPPEVVADALALRWVRTNGPPHKGRNPAMRMRLTHLIRPRRRRRATGRRHQPWPLSEPVVPTLRGWPVERPRR